ncbi:hypothetical protein AJ79_00949 [Helicocarpus griseus UAMH5409]|uniref:Ribonuclease H2 subunit B n=1 Tax=Helicocarpus griseus UAMH5409 TaxID=1447875 RepID=A0A2B7YA56_9EURO|nr:hypothetical protein AJ79_00949 [Helicocarpus griseus UAMH5409]
MRTRSAHAVTPSDKQETKPAPPAPSKPTKTLILPTNASDDARFILLENPRTGALSRYYFCPKLGLYEFTAISSSASIPRSTLFTATTPRPNPCPVTNKQKDGEQSLSDSVTAGEDVTVKDEIIQQVVEDRAPTKATIAKHAQLLVATQVDIMFILLPTLSPASGHSNAQKLFQPLDDMLDSQDTLSKSLKRILLGAFRPKVEARMAAVCDTVKAGEMMYRLNEEKLLRELISKAERMAANGLPPSLEEQYIHRALELPILSVKREDIQTSTTSNTSETANDANEALDTPQDKSESQSSNCTTPMGTSSSDASTQNTEITPPAAELSPSSANSDIRQLLRIRTALSYIQSSYLPKHLSSRVEGLLNAPEKCPRDFTPLTQHLKHVAELRAKALASRSMGDFSRKRGAEDDEEAEIRAEKKRRKEEEEKKKKLGESKGVRDLKKVNVSGMKKLSAFFGKKT